MVPRHAGGLNVSGVATGGYVDTGRLTTGGHLNGADGGGLNVSDVATGGRAHLIGAGGLNVSGVATGGYVNTG